MPDCGIPDLYPFPSGEEYVFWFLCNRRAMKQTNAKTATPDGAPGIGLSGFSDADTCFRACSRAAG
jgi:hypothetical protein